MFSSTAVATGLARTYRSQLMMDQATPDKVGGWRHSQAKAISEGYSIDLEGDRVIYPPLTLISS